MLIQVYEWMERAACLHADDAMWFPEKGDNGNDAKRVCAVCPVRGECLEYALSEEILHGIFGGLSARERLEIRAGRQPAPLSGRVA